MSIRLSVPRFGLTLLMRGTGGALPHTTAGARTRRVYRAKGADAANLHVHVSALLSEGRHIGLLFLY